MCAWHFKKKVIIKKKEITNDARKFEFLVCDYLNACFPLEHWKITPATNDGNRDIEASSNFIGKSMWAEAKYSIHDKTALNSRKYDSTLVSAKNEGNIIKIFLLQTPS